MHSGCRLQGELSFLLDMEGQLGAWEGWLCSLHALAGGW